MSFENWNRFVEETKQMLKQKRAEKEQEAAAGLQDQRQEAQRANDD